MFRDAAFAPGAPNGLDETRHSIQAPAANMRQRAIKDGRRWWWCRWQVPLHEGPEVTGSFHVLKEHFTSKLSHSQFRVPTNTER